MRPDLKNVFHLVPEHYAEVLRIPQMYKDIASCSTISLGDWRLYLSSEFDGRIQVSSTFLANRAFCFGSLLYKSRSGQTAVDILLEDYQRGLLNFEHLKGNFILLIWNGHQIKVIRDRLGVQHLFQRFEGDCFSNSFLGLLALPGGKYKLNQDALAEKIATGFITGADTIVEGIKKVENLIPYPLESSGLSLFAYPEISLELDFHKKGQSNSVSQNNEVLIEYFKELNDANRNLLGDVGLSSGFDCRLILAASTKSIDQPLHIHSHNTKGVHDNEIKYAREIAEIYGTPIDLIPTRRLEDGDDQLIRNTLQENVQFFDGRSARHLGSLSETYTPWYKKASMGPADYSLNGLGGEIYRDSFFMGRRALNWKDWAQRFLFFPLSEFSVSSEGALKDLSYRIKDKIESKLNVNFDKADLFKTHAHYGLVKMPECNGSLAQAYGKISDFYFPFIEYNQIMEALRGINYLGIGATYQARMITALSPEIAKVGSHYGFSFDQLPLKYLIWSSIKTYGSVQYREKLVKRGLLANVGSLETKKFLELVNSSVYLSQIRNAIKNYLPHADFNILVSHSTTRRIILFLGAFLHEYESYIE